MSRYRPTQDGGIAFVGSDLVLTMELDAARNFRGAILALADGCGSPDLAGAYRLWAADLGAAITGAERLNRTIDIGSVEIPPAEPFTSSERSAA